MTILNASTASFGVTPALPHVADSHLAAGLSRSMRWGGASQHPNGFALGADFFRPRLRYKNYEELHAGRRPRAADLEAASWRFEISRLQSTRPRSERVLPLGCEFSRGRLPVFRTRSRGVLRTLMLVAWHEMP